MNKIEELQKEVRDSCWGEEVNYKLDSLHIVYYGIEPALKRYFFDK